MGLRDLMAPPFTAGGMLAIDSGEKTCDSLWCTANLPDLPLMIPKRINAEFFGKICKTDWL